MKNPTALVVVAALALLPPAAVRARPAAKPPPLSAADKAHVLDDTFTVVKTVKQMPAPVQKALGLPVKEPLGGMADAGKPFQIGDAVSGTDKLPFRRLVFAATNPRYCLVYYDLGGIAYREEVILYRLQSGQALIAWRAELDSDYRPATLGKLRAVIKHGKYHKP